MGVKVKEVSVTTVDHRKSQCTRKETYTNGSLPFPSSQHSCYLARWRKSFRATLIDWAGAVEDPFGTNTIMGAVVKQIWCKVFPELREKWKSDSDAITGMVSKLSSSV